MTRDFDGPTPALPTVDLEIEALVAALPFRAPSRRLDARVAAASHFASRPRLTRLRWSASAAAVMLLGAGLALGWAMRDAAPSTWIPAGTDWHAAGLSSLGARRLPDGQVVRSAEALYRRTDRYRDPANGAVIEIETWEPHIMIGRPPVD
jgi:hypothetical protein